MQSLKGDKREARIRKIVNGVIIAVLKTESRGMGDRIVDNISIDTEGYSCYPPTADTRAKYEYVYREIDRQVKMLATVLRGEKERR